jgi:hypothetical protein
MLRRESPEVDEAGPTRDGGDKASAKTSHHWSQRRLRGFLSCVWGTAQLGHLSV